VFEVCQSIQNHSIESLKKMLNLATGILVVPLKEKIQKLIVTICMKQSPSTIMNDEVHKHDDDLERPNIRNKSNGGNDDDDDDDDDEDQHHFCQASSQTQTTAQLSMFTPGTPLIEMFLWKHD
jgi:hypothetical protein